MIKKTLIYWRDIPAQVVVQRGRTREKVLLSARFQTAVDRAAMRAGKGGSDAYLAEWRHVSSKVDSATVDSLTQKSAGDLRELAEREAARLEAEYSDDALARLVRNHGLAQPDTDIDSDTDTDSDTDIDTNAAAAAGENRQ